MNCPVCLWDDWQPYKAEHPSRTYVACKHCGEEVVRLEPLIRFEDALNIYGPDYFEEMQSFDQTARRENFADYGLLEFQSYVEFGAGGDQVLRWLARFGKYVEAVDINPATREHLRRQGISTAATALELERNHFDVALSYHYLEHIRNPALELRYQFTVAEYVLLHMPVGLEELGNADHNWLISAEGVAQMVERFGKIIRSDVRKYPDACLAGTGKHQQGTALEILAEAKR